MKLISYKLNKEIGPYRIGAIVNNNKIIDLQLAYKHLLLSRGKLDLANAIETVFPSLPDQFYALGKEGLEKAKEAELFVLTNLDTSESFTYNEENVWVGPPVPNPSKIICVGKNYKDHVEEMKGDVPDYPVLFAKFTNALIGPKDSIEKSEFTNKLDYEVELAVVIGKEASHVTQDNALDYVAGYTIGNDISARDLQKRTPQWLQGKSLDRSTPIGPWIVTADDLSNPANLAIKSYINGELRQSSNTKHLIFNVPFLIEFISNLITLKPGDILLTGTPDGVGFAMDPPQFLNIGDKVSLEIEGIGVLENIVKEKG